MTEQTVFDTLKKAGFRRNSRSWKDYSRAKQLLLSDWVSVTDYQTILKAITDYLGV